MSYADVAPYVRGWAVLSLLMCLLLCVLCVPAAYLEVHRTRTIYVAVVAPVVWLLYILVFYLLVSRPLAAAAAVYESGKCCGPARPTNVNNAHTRSSSVAGNSNAQQRGAARGVWGGGGDASRRSMQMQDGTRSRSLGAGSGRSPQHFVSMISPQEGRGGGGGGQRQRGREEMHFPPDHTDDSNDTQRPHDNGENRNNNNNNREGEDTATNNTFSPGQPPGEGNGGGGGDNNNNNNDNNDDENKATLHATASSSSSSYSGKNVMLLTKEMYTLNRTLHTLKRKESLIKALTDRLRHSLEDSGRGGGIFPPRTSPPTTTNNNYNSNARAPEPFSLPAPLPTGDDNAKHNSIAAGNASVSTAAPAPSHASAQQQQQQEGLQTREGAAVIEAPEPPPARAHNNNNNNSREPFAAPMAEREPISPSPQIVPS